MRHGLTADRSMPRPLTFGSAPAHDQAILARLVTTKRAVTSSSLEAPRLTLLTGERMTPRAPRLLPKVHETSCPPSIPMCDQAWGYAENEEGILELQQPPMALDPPASYSPTTWTLPCAPNYGFGLTSGRDSLRKSRIVDKPPAGLDGYEEDSQSVRRMPMPVAANALRSRILSPREEPLHDIELHPQIPGPGAFNSPRSVWDVRKVVALPPQRRYRSRAHVAALVPEPPPIPFHGSPRASPRSVGTALAISRKDFAPPPPPPPPRGPISGRAGIRAVIDDSISIEDMLREADERQRRMREALDGDEGELEATRPPPPGLGKMGKKAWRSFTTADASGDGKLSRKELFEALDRQGALDGRSAEWHEAFKAVDDDGDHFIEWDEFQELVRKHPELLDLMRNLAVPPATETAAAKRLLDSTTQSMPGFA